MRGFDLTAWALDKRVVAGTLFTLLALSGVFTYLRLPRSEDPGFTVRQAVIVTEFPGASAARVEELVTDPLEAGLQKLVGLDFIDSTSRPGQSVVIVAADERLKDVPGFWDEMRERVAEQAALLPDEAIGPFINDDFGDVFGTVLAMTGDGFNAAELEDIAEPIQRAFLRIPDIAKVELIGIAPRRIYLEYDEARLADLGVSPDQIASALQRQNIVSPSGRVRGTDRVFELETEGNFRDLDDLASTLIQIGDRAFPLRELVRIRQGFVDDPSAPSMSFAGRPAIGFAMSMAPGGKLTELGPRIRATADALNEDLPLGLELHLASYQTAVVDDAVSGFVTNLLQSVVIVLMVMLAALGFRSGLIVGAMVPMTILTTFSVMGLLGIGIDKMSLTALIIALGLLVDNGIVMSELIMVKRDRGEDILQAAIDSARELRVPLLISSLTTVAALLPTYLAESTTGEYTSPIAEVVALALMTSWVLSLTFVPLCCVLFMRDPRTMASKQAMTSRTAQHYRALLSGLIRYRWVSVVAAVAILFGSGVLMGYVPQQFFPGKPWPQMTIELELPEGTPRARTEAVVRDIEAFFKERFIDEQWSEAEASAKVADTLPRGEGPGIVSWSAFVGEGAPRFILGYAPQQPQENYAYFIVNVENYDTIAVVIEQIEAYLAERFPEALARVLPLRNGPPLQYPVEIRLSGDDIGELRRIVQSTEDQLRSIPGLVRINNNWGPDRPRIRVEVDPVRLRTAGLTHADVAQALDTAFRGRVLSVFRDGNDTVPIALRRMDARDATIDDVEAISIIRARDGRPIPLLQVARVVTDWEPPIIRRRDRQRTITVRADIDANAPRSLTAFSVAAEISTWLDQQTDDWPFGYDWAFGGEVESSGRANASIQAKQPIALLIIVLCLVFQFNTVREPIVVLLTLPFAITGVAIGLFVTQKPFGFMALLGVIALFGIVINNAIVLLDRVQIEISEGRSKLDAVLDASERRLRPILLTTATTVAGLVPLALSGGPLFSPMAVALMSGLIVSTLLTLGLVPVLYAILHGLPNPSAKNTTRHGAAAVVAILFVTAAFTFPASAAPGERIDADEAARRAADRTLDARTAQARLEAARAEEDRVVATFMPRLEGRAQYRRLSDLTQPSLFGSAALVATNRTTTPLTLDDLVPLGAETATFPVILDQWEVAAKLTVPLSKYAFELADALSVAGAGIDTAQLEVDTARIRAAAEARIAYYQWVAALEQRRVFVKQREESIERVRVNEERFRTGQVAQTDVLEAQSALASAELNVARAETLVAVTHEALRQVTRDPAEVAFAPVDASQALPADPPPVPTETSELYREALRQRIELKRLEKLILALDTSESLARARSLPVVEAFGEVLTANPNPRIVPNQAEFDTTWEVGVRLKWSPSDLLTALADDREAAAETEKVRIALENLRLGIQQELVSARQSVVEARSSLESAKRGLAAAESAYAQRKLSYEEGAATLLDLLQSESGLVTAELNAIRARIDAQVARVRLNQATGRDTEAVIGTTR